MPQGGTFLSSGGTRSFGLKGIRETTCVLRLPCFAYLEPASVGQSQQSQEVPGMACSSQSDRRKHAHLVQRRKDGVMQSLRVGSAGVLTMAKQKSPFEELVQEVEGTGC